jgi:hypothetical protein
MLVKLATDHFYEAATLSIDTDNHLLAGLQRSANIPTSCPQFLRQIQPTAGVANQAPDYRSSYRFTGGG